MSAVIKAVDEYQDLLRISISSAGNDHRLGASEAPPAIVSIFLGDELLKILESIEKDEVYADRKKETLQIGVHTIPAFPSDSTDRNRTSPFAFTGNKFEFRMPGSSASIATPNTALNTAVAQELKHFADKLENAGDLNSAVHELIKQTIRDHKRIIFNGNGYDESWIKEAEKRGLSNYSSTPEALAHNLDEKNISVFVENGVMSRSECVSRNEIYLEKYCKTINIEALCMLDMLKKDILPAVSSYETDLKDSLIKDRELDLQQDLYESQTLQAIRERKDGICRDIREMEKLLEKKPSAYGELSFYFHDRIIPLMTAIREKSDQLELICKRSYWPIPTYRELLFGVE